MYYISRHQDRYNCVSLQLSCMHIVITLYITQAIVNTYKHQVKTWYAIVPPEGQWLLFCYFCLFLVPPFRIHWCANSIFYVQYFYFFQKQLVRWNQSLDINMLKKCDISIDCTICQNVTIDNISFNIMKFWWPQSVDTATKYITGVSKA